MKKINFIINGLLIFTFIASIIALGLMCRELSGNLDVYYMNFDIAENDPDFAIELQTFFSTTILREIFSIVFSVLSVITSATVFILLNFKAWKQPKFTENN